MRITTYTSIDGVFHRMDTPDLQEAFKKLCLDRDKNNMVSKDIIYEVEKKLYEAKVQLIHIVALPEELEDERINWINIRNLEKEFFPRTDDLVIYYYPPKSIHLIIDCNTPRD